MARKVVIGESCMRYWEASIDAAQDGRANDAATNLRKYNDCMFNAITKGMTATLALAVPGKRSGRKSAGSRKGASR